MSNHNLFIANRTLQLNKLRSARKILENIVNIGITTEADVQLARAACCFVVSDMYFEDDIKENGINITPKYN